MSTSFLVRVFQQNTWYILSLIIRSITRVKKGRVLLWSTVGKEYGCNPMYISKYLVNNTVYDVWWMFLEDVNCKCLSLKERKVFFRTFKYLYIINTSEFIITNHRTYPKAYAWRKRKNQKYIMTWHGSMPIKMVEKDVESSLPSGYVKMAKVDSKTCDLMISDSKWFTQLIRNSFWYTGEILETSIPRNEFFYKIDKHYPIRRKVLNFFDVTQKDCLLVLYAPTFRTDHGVDMYINDWRKLSEVLKSKYGKPVVVLMRLHPTLLKEVDTETLITSENMKNASVYSDMQELMVASDILITDYSSTMFEFSMMNKPVYLYMPDINNYDRGFYFNINELPFPKSYSVIELLNCINDSDDKRVLVEVKKFINNRFGLYEPCDGCAEIVCWMDRVSI